MRYRPWGILPPSFAKAAHFLVKVVGAFRQLVAASKREPPVFTFAHYLPQRGIHAVVVRARGFRLRGGSTGQLCRWICAAWPTTSLLLLRGVRGKRVFGRLRVEQKAFEAFNIQVTPAPCHSPNARPSMQGYSFAWLADRHPMRDRDKL